MDKPLLTDGTGAMKLLGIGPGTFHQLRQEAAFPEPLLLGKRTVRWRVAELEAWLNARPSQRLPEPAHFVGRQRSSAPSTASARAASATAAA